MGAVLEREVEVRRCTSEDEPSLVRLGANAFGDFSGNAGTTTRRLVHAPSSVTWVAARGSELVGFVIVERHGQATASIQAIAVAPRERCRGVGRRLLETAVKVGRAWGARELRLCTAQANVEALGLFLAASFTIVRRMPRFYPRGQDACELRLLLA